jgi:hypothetical protein
MLKVGISGPIASGKSTLSKMLQQRARDNGFTAEIIPFAREVKMIAATENNAARVIIMASLFTQWGYDSTKAHMAAIMIDQYMRDYPSIPGVKNRRLLQYIGTEVGRDFLHKDIWIYRVQEAAKLYPVLDFLFSDDLRFNNEAFAVDVHINIVTPEVLWDCYAKQKGLFTKSYLYNDHPSEQEHLMPAFFTIPVCFIDKDVNNLFYQLNEVRRLRS